MGVVVASAFAGLGVAGLVFAASLTVSSSRLGAGAADVRCTSGGVTLFQYVSGSDVVAVIVDGVASACGGATLSVTVDNGSASGSGSAAVPAGGGRVTVLITPTVPLLDSHRVSVRIIGP
jgi:hypothetical protein